MVPTNPSGGRSSRVVGVNMKRESKRDRIRALLAGIPDDVGRLPSLGIEIDHEEIKARSSLARGQYEEDVAGGVIPFLATSR